MSKIQFCTICLYWDILASVKAFFTQHWGFWLVTMVTGHHFEFFYDIFKTVKMYTLYLDTSCWLESPFKIRGIVHHLPLLSFLWSILFNRFTFELRMNVHKHYYGENTKNFLVLSDKSNNEFHKNSFHWGHYYSWHVKPHNFI